MVYNPGKMTVKGLKVVLKDLKLCVVAKRALKRKTSKKKLSNWIDAKRLEEDESIQKTQKGTSFIRNRPTLAPKVALSRLTWL